METPTTPPYQPPIASSNFQNMDDNEESSFDIMEWIFKILHHWYLFVISLIITLGIATLVNRTWKPIYQVSAQILLGSGQPSSNSQTVMQGFNLNRAYNNIDNQMIIFTSNELIQKTLAKLNFTVDYYTQGRFKVNDLYGYAPINIIYDQIADNVYGLQFDFHDIDGVSYRITHEKDNQLGYIELTGKYGELLKTPYFTIVVNKTGNFYDHSFLHFAFLSNDYLADYFSSRISLNFVTTNSTVLSVSMTGAVYQRDIDFLNALCDQFLIDNLQRKNEEANRTITFIDSQLSQISDSLHHSEDQLQNYRKTTQVFDVTNYTSSLMGHITTSEDQQLELQLKESYLQYLESYIKRNLNKNQIMTPSSLGVVDPVLVELLNQFNTAQINLSQTSPQNPFYQKYSEELQRIRLALDDALKNVQTAFNIEKEDLKKQSQNAASRLESLPEIENRMNSFQRKYAMNDTYYTYLLQKRAEAEIQQASNVPDNSILERARMISVTNSSEKSHTRMMALILGLLLPFLIIILKEFLKVKILDKRDIEKITKYPYLGNIPHVVHNEGICVLHHPKSSVAESYRIIRTRINFVAQKNDTACIVVTSTESGDGKSHFSLNYASICAMSHEKTILVGLDLRKPSLASFLGLENKIGVTNVLLGEVSLEDAIIHPVDNHFNFDLLLAGSVPPNPGELIRSHKLVDIIKHLKETYQYVILDTSPVGIVSDAYPLMTLTDAVIYVVRSKKTNKKFFKTVIRQLKTDGITHIGLVLNDLDTSKSGYGYHDGYHRYGYGYYGKRIAGQEYNKDYYYDE
ncbi:GumC family protein [Microbacter margulisiae]|uniref:Capsular exopolysaccharide synthesis family protein n=1 Tax=Microbacter margulisiae TaxID=1350067 RepID=A0A7W5DP12_9PORP|nr:polysaccharide biosynthesis tyrosine autokinase [Microbacter margulisiae]MBB3186462.1 capsular exopolysaccharide synthesis family protein [Microbacter margulisiae]